MKCYKCNTDNPQQANYCKYCGAKFDNSPEIDTFYYVSIPHVGDSIELSWSIKNADIAILNGQTMPLTHRHKVVVDKEMTWELVATKSGKRDSRILHIMPILSSNKTTEPSTPPIFTSSDALPYLMKVLLRIRKDSFIVLDNASVHRCKLMRELRPIWEKQGLFLFFLPPYSPHLNIVEMLWRILKDKRLRPIDYVSTDSLLYATNRALVAIGTKLKINFAHVA